MYIYDEIDQRLVEERVAQFRGQVRRYLEGKLSLEEFLPLLCLGQLTHVGRRAVFGLGRYRVLAA